MAGRKPLDRQTLSVRALDVAEAIIAARGLNALNAREVAASVGCSVGSLYNIFGSLDRLIRFVNTRTLDRLYEAMKAAATKDKPVDQMVAICCAYIEFAIAQPLLWRAVFDHRMLEGKPRLEWYGDSIERMSTLAITVLSPLFKPDELWAAKHVATILWSGVHGICSLAQADNLPYVTQEDPLILAEDLVRGYLAGVTQSDPTTLFARNL
ncbi:MAG: TetR/AcrR family transcriptional regulator [Geminicoccales bacterium]